MMYMFRWIIIDSNKKERSVIPASVRVTEANMEGKSILNVPFYFIYAM